VAALPEMDMSNKDKVMLFRCGERKKSFPEKYELERTIRAELPAFLGWLVNWVPPEKVLAPGRYGVVSYQETSLMSTVSQNSDISSFAEVIETFFEDYFQNKSHGLCWEGTAMDLKALMSTDPWSGFVREYSNDRFGSKLRQLSHADSSVYRIIYQRNGSANCRKPWKIAPRSAHLEGVTQ